MLQCRELLVCALQMAVSGLPERSSAGRELRADALLHLGAALDTLGPV